MIGKWLTGLATAILLLEIETSAGEKPAVIPQPASMAVNEGSFALGPDTVVFCTEEKTRHVASTLVKWLAPATGFSCRIEKDAPVGAAGIVLTAAGADPGLGPEGYTLTVSPKVVVIRAPEAAGVFYGVQTFLQLLPPEIESSTRVEGKAWTAPCVEISDRPRFAWRGLLLDVARHFYTKDDLQAYLDRMARYKLNVLQLHLTDDQGWRIEIKKRPRLTEIGAWRVPRVGPFYKLDPPQPGERPTYGGFYSQDDVRELVAYARERFVTILPEIECPGHGMAALAAYPELSCTGGPFTVDLGSDYYGRIENGFCPGKESTFAVLEDVFSEVASLFPGPYVHIGGDEAFKGFWKKCPECAQRMREHGLKDVDELQSYFVKRVEKILHRRGKRLIGWDEILEGGLAPDATVMSWRGTKGGVAAAKMNHDVVMSPQPYYYLDHCQGERVVEPEPVCFGHVYGLCRLNTTYHFEPLPEGLDPKRVLGVQANLWTEAVTTLRHAEYMTWPRGFAVAETAWSPKELKEWPEFVRRVEEHFRRFDAADCKYAPSMYDVELVPSRRPNKTLVIELATEIPGLAIHYTFDGSLPDARYPKYEGPLAVPKNAAVVRAITSRNGKCIGRIVSGPIAELEGRADRAAGKR
jgi:hexosaminidase